MAGYYLDSSAVVKRYVQETGTAWVRGITRQSAHNVIYIARITAVEVTCAIARQRKGRKLTAAKASSVLRRFRKHVVGRYTVIEITPALLENAVRLGNTHALRAYDAVQIAVAIEVNRTYQSAGANAVTFVSADVELNDAALAEGLIVDDPNTHT